VKWFRKAAEQGNAEGQYNLGVCYAKGDGVDEDDVAAYMWTNLAAASDSKIAKSAKKLRIMLESKMASGEIVEARMLSRDWKPLGYQKE
jgi:TPR repeat protein